MLRMLCLRDRGVARHHVEAVAPARVHVQLGGHARLVESQRVVDVFVAEAVGRADRHERGRQPREIGRARRAPRSAARRRSRRGRRGTPSTRTLLESRLHTARPSSRLDGVSWRSSSIGWSRSWKATRHLAAVAREQAQRRGETAARAHAHHADAVRIDAELVGVVVASTASRGSSLRAVRDTASRVRGGSRPTRRRGRASGTSSSRTRIVHQVRADHVAAAVDRVHAREHAVGVLRAGARAPARRGRRAPRGRCARRGRRPASRSGRAAAASMSTVKLVEGHQVDHRRDVGIEPVPRVTATALRRRTPEFEADSRGPRSM